jgi:hypothetical protein
MKTNLFIVVLLLMATCAASSPAAETILLSLPQSVIAETVSKSLPIQFTEASETLAGTITIKRIDNLVFKDQLMSGTISVSGRDMQINTSFGSQQIRVNVGNVDLGFSVSATTRYDKARRTLLLHPTVTGIDEQGPQNGEIGKLILALFNDQDIPITLDKLQPIITDIGSKKLVIDTQIEDVMLKPGKLDINLLPRTTVKK